MLQNLRRRRIIIGAPVAVLIIAAIAVPMLVSYSCACSEDKFGVEHGAIQFAMDLMMVDQDLTRVDARTSGPAVNDWTAFPTGAGTVVLSEYLESTYLEGNISEFYFCWNAEGEVYPRNDNPAIASKPGECYSPP